MNNLPETKYLRIFALRKRNAFIMRTKGLLLSLIFLFTIICSFAQQEPPQSGKTAEDVLRGHELQERMRDGNTPVAPVTSIPEFVRCQGVLVAYAGYTGFGIPYNLIAQMSELVTVTVAVSSSYQQNTVRTQLQNNNVNMDNVNFVIGSVDSYWTRDFGPWFIIDGNDDIGVADFTYNRPSRPNDDNHMAIMANFLGVNHFDFPLVHTGGNYMSDGYGAAASTDLVFEENPDLTQAEIRQLCTDYLGIDNYHFTIDPQGDYIAHIDCWGKFLDVDKVMIAQLPVGANRYQEYEQVADYFANATSSWGNKYKVYRVFEPGSTVSNARTPYTNCLILNDHVFVPITGCSYDDDAIECYRNAMPGYTIVPIMEKSSTPWENTDALHCRTHEIPDLGLLYIRHYPTLGHQPYQPTFTFQADITCFSGQGLISDSVRIAYRIIQDQDTSLWDYAPMQPIGGKTWEGTISGITDTCTVQYFLKASDLSGRNETMPLIAAADPYTFTVAPNDNGDDPDDPGDTTTIPSFASQNITIAPNPADEQFTIQANHVRDIFVYNLHGQLIHTQHVTGDIVTVDCAQWGAGTYFINLIGHDGVMIRKKVVVRR